MPNTSNIQILASDTNRDIRVSSVNWTNDSIVTVSNAESIIGYVNNRPNWQSLENPYYDYVSDLNNILKDINIKDGLVYVNSEKEFASYKKLIKIVGKILDLYNRSKSLETHREPRTCGEEYND